MGAATQAEDTEAEGIARNSGAWCLMKTVT